MTKMRAIKNTKDMTIEIKEGTLILADDQSIEFGNSLAK